MKKGQLHWIVGLMALATLAIVGLQGYIWNQSIQEERRRFSERVQQAVFDATEALVQPWQSSIVFLDDHYFSIRRDSLDRTATFHVGLLDSTATGAFFRQPDHGLIHPDTLTGDFTLRNSNRWESSGVAEQLHTLALPDSMRPHFTFRYDQACPSCPRPSLTALADTLKPLLREHLLRQGVRTDFEWGVRQVHSGKWLVVEGDTARVQKAHWRFPMFVFAFDEMENTIWNTDVFSPPLLSLYFPGENWHLLRNIAVTLAASVLLALMVLGCMAYAFHVIVQQKQLSEIKTDFINNMTHELKTPISTIALACEALQDAEVTLSPALHSRYMEMITMENERLAAQVEKVLQMALLDRKDLGLKLEPVNLHVLLRQLEEAFSIQIGQRGGRLTTVLEAQQAVVVGDGLHLRQMLCNLLDNANKYSPHAPDIHVVTRNKEQGIEIAVRDQGRGISRDALRKIFDRFYRVPTGNRHDVKGFGLGLSYVQTMALAHGGHVRATSRPGRGSTFYLYLPHRHA